MGYTLVDLAVDGIADAALKLEAQGANLRDLTLASINELHEAAGDYTAFDTLTAVVLAAPEPFTVDQALAAVRQAATYAIDVYMPWYGIRTILRAVWRIPERRW